MDAFQGREKEVIVVHDNAYAELGYDGYEPPSILQADGAKEVAVELYSMTKSFSMAGWRVAFMVGNKDVVRCLAECTEVLSLARRDHPYAELYTDLVRRCGAMLDVSPKPLNAAGLAEFSMDSFGARGGITVQRSAAEAIIASQTLPERLRFAAHIAVYSDGCGRALRPRVEPGAFPKAPQLGLRGLAVGDAHPHVVDAAVQCFVGKKALVRCHC